MGVFSLQHTPKCKNTLYVRMCHYYSDRAVLTLSSESGMACTKTSYNSWRGTKVMVGSLLMIMCLKVICRLSVCASFHCQLSPNSLPRCGHSSYKFIPLGSRFTLHLAVGKFVTGVGGPSSTIVGSSWFLLSLLSVL